MVFARTELTINLSLNLSFISNLAVSIPSIVEGFQSTLRLISGINYKLDGIVQIIIK